MRVLRFRVGPGLARSWATALAILGACTREAPGSADEGSDGSESTSHGVGTDEGSGRADEGGTTGASTGETGSTTGEATSSGTGSEGSSDGSTSGFETSTGTGFATGTETGTETRCGDGVVDDGEACDGTPTTTCADLGFVSGTVACDADCALDVSDCTQCGDGMLDPDEACDGEALGATTTCADVGLGLPDEPLTCTANCTHDLTGCSGCGDGTISTDEECEPGPPADFAGLTCESFGHDGGELTCDRCTIDESLCHRCGDGIRGGPEQCDGPDLGGQACTDIASPAGPPYTSGTLDCDLDCTYDVSYCEYCGDGVISGSETCDGANFGGLTCRNLGFPNGDLQCTECQLDLGDCSF